MYALVQNDTIVQVGALPRIWRDAEGEDHDWRRQPYRTEPAAQGWLPVVTEPRPEVTTATVAVQDRPTLVAGVPTITWTVRDKTPEEIQAEVDMAAAEAAQAEHEATRLAIRAIVLDIKAEKDRAQAVIDKANANLGPADTKDLARAIKRMADANIDLAKFVRDL